MATPTASGKTLIYNLPVLATMMAEPQARALYLFPLKALEQDQLKAVRELDAALPSPFLAAAIYDGDTPPAQRQALKSKPPHVLISNPDMLHMGILPYHASWSSFFKNLRYVVIDEVHTYRGIIGQPHGPGAEALAADLRPLRLSPAIYPDLSATIAEPAEFIRNLTGLEVETHRRERRPPVRPALSLSQPPGRCAPPPRPQIFSQAIRKGLATICFTQARKLTELIHLWALRQVPELRRYISFVPGRVSAGGAPGDRDQPGLGQDAGGDLHQRSGDGHRHRRAGRLHPGGLPRHHGDHARQRSGRVGRQDRDSLVVLVAQADALDQYFMKNPDGIFRPPPGDRGGGPG